AKVHDRLLGAGRPNAKERDELVRDLLLPVSRKCFHYAAARLQRENDVLADGKVRHDPFYLAVFRSKGEAFPNRVARRSKKHLSPLQKHFARWGFVIPKQQTTIFCAAGPKKASQADDFALP